MIDTTTMLESNEKYSIEYLPTLLELFENDLEYCIQLKTEIEKGASAERCKEVKPFVEASLHRLQKYQPVVLRWREAENLTPRQRDWLTSLRMLMVLLRRKLSQLEGELF